MYELQTLEALLSQKNYISIELLQLEQQKIESEFLDVVYSEQSYNYIKTYVRQHTESLNRILRAEELETSTRLPIFKVLQNLISFLEHHAAPYWSYDIVLPGNLIKDVLFQ